MLRKKRAGSISILAVIAVLVTACTGKQEPGWEFMPDMYRGPSIQTYEANRLFKDSLSARQPGVGSIPRGFMAYEAFDPTDTGLLEAKDRLTMPGSIPTDSLALAEAGKLYGIYCSLCHGQEGDGQGILVQNEVFLGVPSYADRDINLGSIFHVVTYGKGVMGSHAAQVTPEERWKIAQYVLQLRTELIEGTGEGEDEDSEEEDTGDAGTEDTENAEGTGEDAAEDTNNEQG